MFGYIKAYKPDLKVAEFEVYRGVYCSLCRTLGKRYSTAARMTLSYDFTFFALMIMALKEENITFRKGYCSYAPMIKKRILCDTEHNEALNISADVAMLLVYHKLTDSICDDRFWKRQKARLAQRFIKRDYKRACKRRPDEARAVEQYIHQQTCVEKAAIASVDAAAEPTALLMEKLASMHFGSDNNEVARRFAYCLGRYIYLADAADDIEEDIQSGNYNPYVASTEYDLRDSIQLQLLKEYAVQSLHGSMAVCAECYEELTIYRFDGIIRNIIYQGVPSVIRSIQNGNSEEKQHEQSL